jgi:hypothetical protein
LQVDSVFGFGEFWYVLLLLPMVKNSSRACLLRKTFVAVGHWLTSKWLFVW